MSDPASANRASRGPGVRRSRWARRSLAAALVLVAILLAAVGALMAALAQLDRPWLKRRVQGLVRASAGIEVDYASVRVRPFSGARVDGLLLLQPAPFRGVAPHLLRVGRLEVAWSLSSLLGAGARIERVAIDDVDVAIVEDEGGRTSFDGLGGGAGGSSSPAGNPFAGAPPFGQLDVARAGVTLLRCSGGEVRDRLALSGLAVHAETRPASGGWRIDARAGTASAPLPLLLARDRTSAGRGSAALELSLAGQADPSSAAATLDLRAGSQTTPPLIRATELVHVQIAARFEREATEISVAQARVADGAATAQAELAIPAAPGTAVLRRASGMVDLERLLRAAPAGLVPLAGRGTLTWRAQDVALAGVPRLLPGGSAEAQGDLSGLRVDVADGFASLERARLALGARPGPEGPVAQASLTLRGLSVALPSWKASADTVAAQLDASRGGQGAWSGAAHLRMSALELAGGSGVDLHGIRVDATTRDLRFDPASPLAARGDVEVAAEVASIRARAPGGGAAASGAGFRLHVPLTGGAPFTAQLEVPVRELRLLGADGRLLASAPVRLDASLADAVPDLEHPAASRARVRATARAGPLAASIDAEYEADRVAFQLAANARGVALARLMGWQTDPGPLDAALSATGRAEALWSADPAIHQRAELRLEGPALRRISARSLALAVRSDGGLRRHHADLDLRVDRGESADAWRVTASADVDGALPSVAFALTSEGGPSASISGSLRPDRARRAFRCDLEGRVGRLGPASALLSLLPGVGGLDLSELELSLALHGTVRDLAAGKLSLPRSPLTAAAEGALDVRARSIRWHADDRALEAPSAVAHLELQAAGARRKVQGTVVLDALRLLAGEHVVDAAAVSAKGFATLDGDPAAGESDFGLQASVRSLSHDLGAYPVANAGLTVAAHRSAEGMLRISDLRLENPAGGTSLALQGGVYLGFVRRRLSLRGQLQQDFARISSAPESFEGRGHLSATFRVDSSDLALFRTQAALRLTEVHARLPRAGASFASLNGEIPVSADVAVDSHGVTLLRGAELNPYSLHRFADQHPLLSRSSYLTVGSITTRTASIAPLAGNLKIVQNVLSLSQLDMGLRGGRVTGECVLDWNGEDSTLRAHVRATGVQSSHGEPFDGNAAVVVSASERSMDGRIEILRIGSRHLLDLLDLQDPLRADPATNRIRYALKFGYPDKARVVFNHGFASMRVTFGGLARFLTVGDLRGIPTGPIVDKVLGPLMQAEVP